MKRFFSLCFLIVCASASMAQVTWPAITQQSKPWTRWWWMGSAVDKENINKSLQQYAKAGFGGVEIVPIYGAKGFEHRYIKYLSPEWMKILDHTVQQSTALDMGVYISVGTGWPIGGTHVTNTDAASKAIVQQYDLKKNTKLKEQLVVNNHRQKGPIALSVLMGYNSKGQSIDLSSKVDAAGNLNYLALEDLKLVALFNAKTMQAVKRAAPGGEGLTIDHFSKQATSNYFKIFDTAFGNRSHGVKGFFNDSYEVYGANWTPEFFKEFEARRGYDLKNYLNLLFSDQAVDQVARIKSDYRETMSDLMRENFSTVYTDWTHKRNTLSVNQAHGSPGNLLDLYGAFDVPETETFGSSYFPIKGLRRDSGDIRNVDPDPNMLKFASSAAHVYGKPLTSSETFTWLGEHFKTAWSQCKPEVDQVFLSGVNHVFYHGTTYSPADAKWPGWLFYASVNFVPNNSLWPHLSGLNNYISRCQAVLQAGQPDNELAIYWPVYDVWHNAKGMDKPLSVHHVDDWLHPTSFYKNLQALQKEGYALDFISDRMLNNANVNKGLLQVGNRGATYKILVVPSVEKMPVSTFKDLMRIANTGGVVIMEHLPKDVPGFKNTDQQRAELEKLVTNLKLRFSDGLQTANIGKGKIIVGNTSSALSAQKVYPETMAKFGLKFIRRKATDGVYYFVVNQTAWDIDEMVVLENTAESVSSMDPLTGEARFLPFKQGEKDTGFRLRLKSGASIILKLSNKVESAAVTESYLQETETVIDLSGNKWSISFKNGGPQVPSSRLSNGIRPWTSFTEDPATQSFSGTGVYSTSFTVKNKAKDYLLKLNNLYESAKIIINGKDAGLIWSLPFEMQVGKYLKEGVNSIQIEVCNLMANRIRYMDLKHEVWRNYHEINFVNINYKDFDAGKWNVQPSGLDGAVKLIALQ